MAANNYFGFTTGGTQYGTAPATSYPATQAAAAAGYTVQHAAQHYATTAPRASQATYDNYQQSAATHSSTTYPYVSRQQPTYEKAQTYYPQASQVTYSTGDTAHYQTVSKPSYSTNTVGYTARQGTAQKTATAAATGQAAVAAAAASSYMYSTNTGAVATASYPAYNTTTTYGATAVYVQQPSLVAHAGASTGVVASTPLTSNVSATQKVQGTWMPFKKSLTKIQKPKLPPKPQQLHYCEVCKISCAGPQTYKEHLEGQKHKKKEAAVKAGNATTKPVHGGTSLRCELCDVTCTGSDAYAAHIRGAKHQKVVKLHTRLGKPIPSTDPVVLNTNSGGSAKTSNSNSTAKGTVGKPGIASSASKADDSKMDDGTDDDEKMDVQPVGQDYIEEIKNDEGKVISFQCKLCECCFNDPNAKEMHMKGRRHRLQYKKKVNPDLVVDIKPSLRQRRLQEEKLKRQQLREDFWKRREEDRWRDEMRMMEEEERMYWEERRRFEEEMEYFEWQRRFGREPRMMPPGGMRGFPGSPHFGMGPHGRRPYTVDDRHVVAKHTQIYPKEEELNGVQKIVTNTEKALKLVSDYLAELLGGGDAPAIVKQEKANETPAKEGEEKDSQANLGNRVLKGVMRVGVLAKGLLLTGDQVVQLVVMCSEKPTRNILDRVAENLPVQLAKVAPDDKYEVKRIVEEAAILVKSLGEASVSVLISLTSPVMRDTPVPEGTAPAEKKDPADILDKQKCLKALAALRHAKWFQARASSLQSCVMVIRILRDLCQRIPTWGRLNTWAMELLVEKAICSAGQILSPGDALRRVFEAIASGILLPGGPGLMDPCEKEPLDAVGSLTNQDREDITTSAQHALRLIAFRQIHKVLGMDPLPPPKNPKNSMNRKRRLDSTSGEGTETEGGDGKKDKKEEEVKASA